MQAEEPGFMVPQGGADTANPDDTAAYNNSPKKFSSNAIYLARTAQINTLTLSQMADNKASILIGATFVVFSLAVTKLIGAQLTWAILALALTAFAASLCAVFALLPASKGSPKGAKDANLLFFGNFAGLDEKAWQDRLINDFHDDEAVLRLMLRDVYQNGQILHRRKYRFLNYAYRAFLIGLSATMVIHMAETLLGLPPISG